jgi:CRISPR system Cascade subunit CasC
MEKNFVNYHILISHSPSCLNRDDMNMQKTSVFGGKRRVRLSSQSMKRTMRQSAYYKKYLGEPSIRTRELEDLKKLFLEELRNEYEESVIIEAMERFVKETIKATEEDETKEISEEKEGRLAVAPWIQAEIRVICDIIKSINEVGLNEEDKKKAKDKFDKQKKPKKGEKKPLSFFENQIVDKRIKDHLSENAKALAKAKGSAIDVALSGRMATSGLMTKVDGALAVAHAITTHAVESDIDWFTAVDDLQELGSGHLDTQEFSSGVFYRYASLNITQLEKNLGGVPRARVLDIAAHVLHMLATEVPSAKQQSFAAHNLADLAFVSVSDQPISLANAFEAPVKAAGDGFLKPSVDAFHDYWQRIYQGYGLDDRCAEFALHGQNIPEGIEVVDTISELESWIRRNDEG